MPIDAGLLTLTQWLSPAFPTGAFAYSHGIESAVHEGWITDAAMLESWLGDCLTDGAGRADAIWLRLAFAAADPLEVDADARSFAISRERLREGERQGAAFVATVNAVWNLDVPQLLLPVAVGRAARLAALDVDASAGLYLQSFVANLASVAIRLGAVGQTDAQLVVARLHNVCLEVAEETKAADADDVFGSAFLSDIAAMSHETLQPRLFQS